MGRIHMLIGVHIDTIDRLYRNPIFPYIDLRLEKGVEIHLRERVQLLDSLILERSKTKYSSANCLKMCFELDKEDVLWEQQLPSDVGDIDDYEDHILKPSYEETINSQTSEFDVCGNYRCLCEICKLTTKNDEKSRDYRLSRLLSENEKFKTLVICRNCKMNVVQILTLPCSHIVCCVKCADILDNCPLCTERILGTVRIFMS